MQIFTQLLQTSRSRKMVVLQERVGSGLVSISLSRPSPVDAPFLVRYMAWDVAGNAAAPRIRVVHVACDKVSGKVCSWLVTRCARSL